MTTPIDVRLYALTDHFDAQLVDRVQAALRGGITALQLRLKRASARDLMEVGRTLLPLCRAANVPLLINDRLDIALALRADGAHLGPEDISIADARTCVPTGFLLGASAGDAETAAQAWRDGADYLGVGAIYNAHPSKANASAPRGTSVLRDVRQAVPIPIVAIGGVSYETTASCIAAGATGVAVIRAVFADAHPDIIEHKTRALRAEIDRAHAL